jgi:hypothetical protein
MAPKGEAKDAAKDEDPMRALLKLSVKHANSAAFTDMSESRITAEQVRIDSLTRNPQCLHAPCF